MDKSDKIYVAGHNGLIGSATIRRLLKDGYTNIATVSHLELDLTDQHAVKSFFEREKPDYVFFAAAKVGGVFANNTYRAEFIYENLMMQCNVVQYSFVNEVKKLIFFASADIYPKNCPQPAKEEYLLTGKLESTSEPFALAKIAGLKMCESYNRQYGTNYLVVIPANVYGSHQHYDALNAQVMPSLLKRLHEAKVSNVGEVEIWGTGSPVRDFIYVDDVADASIFLMNEYSGNEFFNIGTGIGCSISELVEKMKAEVGYKGEITYDTTRPDGVPKKLLDTTKINNLGWKCKTPLSEGIRYSYRSFLEEIKKKEVRTAKVSKIIPVEKDVDISREVESQRSRVQTYAQPDNYKKTVVLKPWGHEFLIFENDCVAVWFLYIKNGYATSMHSHTQKKTSLVLLSGSAVGNTFYKRWFLKGGDALVMEKGVFHSTKALSEDGIFLLEIETPPHKTDLMRLEDRYGREMAGYEGITEMQSHNLEEYDYFYFDGIEHYKKCSQRTERFIIELEIFMDSEKFRKNFKPKGGEVYASCRGQLVDSKGKVVLDVGEAQKADIFSDIKELRITEKAVLLKTITLDR